ncbi:hypothetical protein F5Y04DRAFT_169143 [Hypomontagnella monticulosa]|nr:hypothetical protein F5Y04DRAFT_169143 [Hypomontagnella monticulosa]
MQTRNPVFQLGPTSKDASYQDSYSIMKELIYCNVPSDLLPQFHRSHLEQLANEKLDATVSNGIVTPVVALLHKSKENMTSFPLERMYPNKKLYKQQSKLSPSSSSRRVITYCRESQKKVHKFVGESSNNEYSIFNDTGAAPYAVKSSYEIRDALSRTFHFPYARHLRSVSITSILPVSSCRDTCTYQQSKIGNIPRSTYCVSRVSTS